MTPQLKPPSRVTPEASAPTVTTKVKVQIRRTAAALAVTVPDLATLAARESRSTSRRSPRAAVAPVATLVPGKPNRRVPRQSPAEEEVDGPLPLATSRLLRRSIRSRPAPVATPGHDDFRWTATLHPSALTGIADTHAADDVCPRPTLPGGVDRAPTRRSRSRTRAGGGKLRRADARRRRHDRRRSGERCRRP